MSNKLGNQLIILSAFSFLVVICGCAKSERSFLIAQVCLNDQQDVSELRNLIKSIANAEHMEFIDRSEDTRRELQSINSPDLHSASPVINFGIVGEDGIGLTAGNMGMPPNQVAIGFTGVSDLPRANQLASSVVNKIKERWLVEILPEGAAAQGMRECRH
jgi:hypothetical protein